VEVSGTNVARVFFHYTDPNNAYFIEFDNTAAAVKLIEIVNGASSVITTGAYTTGASVPVKIKLYDDAGAQRIKIWVNGTERINTTDASHPAGGVAFGGDANFDNVVIGYDTDADDAIDDKVMDESFGSTSVTVSHDKAGNLIDDGTFEYQYDAYHRLVKVRSSVDADVTYQTANFDGLGRRIKKVVASSGDLDGTTVFYYDGQRIVETRDGSGNLVSQFVRGLRYIDEVVMVRVKDEGELYVHQDANWNVVGLTDLGGRLVERYVYRPYGEVIVHQLGGYADYDADGDVDANDRGEITGLTCGGSNPSGACRVLDLDFDNDCDASDETVFDSLPHTGTVIHPARRSSLLGQPFAHQGLFLDSEIGSYQNRRSGQFHAPMRRTFGRHQDARFAGRMQSRGTLSLYLEGDPNPASKNTNGCRVCLICNPVWGTNWIHCELKVRGCGEPPHEYPRIEGFNCSGSARACDPGLCCPWNLCAAPYLVPPLPDRPDAQEIECTDGSGAMSSCIRETCRSYPRTQCYAFFPDPRKNQGNSNTQAQCISLKCGIKWSLQPTDSVPGWFVPDPMGLAPAPCPKGL
jgi:hypothetical protein